MIDHSFIHQSHIFFSNRKDPTAAFCNHSGPALILPYRRRRMSESWVVEFLLNFSFVNISGMCKSHSLNERTFFE